jgi:steroid 5-alpha reductase family enzyme
VFGVLAWSLPAAMAVMAALYWLQRRRGDAGVVDVGWAAGIGLVAVAAAAP